VRVALEPRAFMLWDARMREVVEPGMFDILVGPDSRDLQSVALEIA
jgi:beta-glucosidase